MNYIYVQGKLTEVSSGGISIFDRSFKFGDGIFETALVANGKIYDWQSHQERMEDGLKYFKLDVDVSRAGELATELLKRNNITEGYIRIVISRGDSAGVVGYKVGVAKPYMVITTIAKPLPKFSSAKLFLSPKSHQQRDNSARFLCPWTL